MEINITRAELAAIRLALSLQIQSYKEDLERAKRFHWTSIAPDEIQRQIDKLEELRGKIHQRWKEAPSYSFQKRG
jgi:hypothetical protein